MPPPTVWNLLQTWTKAYNYVKSRDSNLYVNLKFHFCIVEIKKVDQGKGKLVPQGKMQLFNFERNTYVSDLMGVA